MNEKSKRSALEINLDIFRSNLQAIKRELSSKVEYMQVVKADAYGHGAVEISKVAAAAGIKYFGVANALEGVHLRENGISGSIIILGPSLKNEIPAIIKYRLTPSISDMNFAEELSITARKKTPVHIEIDTGMGRGGIHKDDALATVKKILRFANLSIEGIFSHFPEAEKVNSYSIEQIKHFTRLLRELDKEGIAIRFRHIANSGGFLNYPNSIFNMVRIGLLSYGYSPDGSRPGFPVRPVMSFKTEISLVKRYRAGESISYGRTFITKKDTYIAVLPVGYADGIPRTLSNKGTVLIKGQSFPIVGTVSMDMLMVDVSGAMEKIRKGDEAVLIGSSKGIVKTADDLAHSAGTISYEILTQIGKRAVKFYFDSKKTGISKPVKSPVVIKNLGVLEIYRQIYGIDLSEDFFTKFSSEVTRKIFGESWHLVKEDFTYDIALFPREDHYEARLFLSFRKWAEGSSFRVGVTNDPSKLTEMLRDHTFLYRWFLNSELKKGDFKIMNILIDGEKPELVTSTENKNSLIYEYSRKLGVRNTFNFTLEVKTKYSREDKVFPVFFSDFTKNAEISFRLKGRKIRHFEFFSGKDLKVTKKETPGAVILKIPGNYIFPQSGILFYWD